MDDAIIAAFEKLCLQHKATADAILEDPELRQPFLAEVRQVVGHLPERDILHRLTSLRKASKLTRSRDLLARRTDTVHGEAA